MRKRRYVLAVVVLAMVTGLLISIPSSSARTTSSQNTWYRFWVHMNAYAHWTINGCFRDGGQNATWKDYNGGCGGSMEAGDFRAHAFVHSTRVGWGWNGSELTVHGPGFTLYGVKPYNWFWYTVQDAVIDGVHYESGSTGSPGHMGGPLYVNLSSRQYLANAKLHEGQSMDLEGYLRAK
ncbi:MAG TPA: hypothetical protein VGH52_04450 [Gaiellaceae bacterium]|jgi:hypothetical protein